MSNPQIHHGGGLPWESESIAQVQARFAAALATVYDVFNEDNANVLRIGRKRKHCFDLEHGFRMICSLERYNPRQPVILHISFSVTPETASRSKGMKEPQLIGYLHQLAKEVSRGRLEVAEVKVTEHGVVHFFYEANAFMAKLDPVERKLVGDWLGRGKAA